MDCKMRVNDKQFVQVQKAAFRNGMCWANGSKLTSYVHSDCLFIRDGKISHYKYGYDGYFESVNLEELEADWFIEEMNKNAYSRFLNELDTSYNDVVIRIIKTAENIYHQLIDKQYGFDDIGPLNPHTVKKYVEKTFCLKREYVDSSSNIIIFNESGHTLGIESKDGSGRTAIFLFSIIYAIVTHYESVMNDNIRRKVFIEHRADYADLDFDVSKRLFCSAASILMDANLPDIPIDNFMGIIEIAHLFLRYEGITVLKITRDIFERLQNEL